MCDHLHFNPRPREEGDKITKILQLLEGISIHALVKRATNGDCLLPDRQQDFNPRPREEGDSGYECKVCYRHYFNPRPREEGDLKAASEHQEEYISIHALVKRATGEGHIDAAYGGISIHALVKRATAKCLITMSRSRISIHALVKRATQKYPVRSAKSRISIHALVKRATEKEIV